MINWRVRKNSLFKLVVGLKREDGFEMPLQIIWYHLKMTYGLFDLCWNIDLRKKRLQIGHITILKALNSYLKWLRFWYKIELLEMPFRLPNLELELKFLDFNGNLEQFLFLLGLHAMFSRTFLS